MIVKWNYYIKRKKIDIRHWLKRHNVKNYSELVSVAVMLDIIPPEEKVVTKYFISPEVKKNAKKHKNTSQSSGKDNRKVRASTKRSASSNTEAPQVKQKRVRKPRKKQTNKQKDKQ